ncbi:unnamed protein product, partial [Oikopleura dioica]
MNSTNTTPLSISETENNKCGSGIHWIFLLFGQCVTTPHETVGFFLGIFSIFCWFLVYIPQLYENYKRGRCDDALSIWFLIFWLFGDTANLSGCLLTHQFPIQTLTAIYYVIMDVGIIAQFFFYTLKNKTQHPLPKNWSAAAFVVAIPLTSHSFGANLSFNSTAEEIGYLVGLCSTCFYLGSRLPQIIKNFKRGKTEGVHPFTFLLAVVANVAYASSVLLSKTDDGQSYKKFVMEHLPWLLGSLGTVLLDFT